MDVGRLGFLDGVVCGRLGGSPFGRLSMYEMYLWVADPRQVPFLCLPKEKEPKEKAPRSLRPRNFSAGALRSSPLPDARPTRRARKTRASGSNTVERIPPVAVAVLGLLYGGSNGNHPRCLPSSCVFCRVPVWRGFEHRRVWGEARQGSGQEVRSQHTAQGGAVCWRGPQTREAQKLFAPFGVAFSLVAFFWRDKRKRLAVGQPPTPTFHTSSTAPLGAPTIRAEITH